jgi:phosphoribosyl 1,2-cyclic phosphodiesterase
VTRVTLWGTRGSLASPGADTARYGGNTSCVEVRGPAGTVVVLDAGTGIRRLGNALAGSAARIHLLLSHLHMDHIQGLGFFGPLHDPDVEVHIWGPGSTTLDLKTRLNRYLSPPLFPVHLRDLPRLIVHEVGEATFALEEFRVTARLVCHPGPTVGYRLECADGVLAYLSDHEPALGAHAFPQAPDWTSGFAIARGADLLIHDAQYADEEYPQHVGWGHSTIDDALRFATLAGVKRLVTFHHDPEHSDEAIERMTARAIARHRPGFPVSAGAEGTSFQLG